MSYFFTSESVSEGHPDKIADQISDALLDNFLAFDPESKVACETLVTTGQVILAGEVKSGTYLDVQSIARETINAIGYTKGAYQFSGDSCGVVSLIHEQSQDINRGVDREEKEAQGVDVIFIASLTASLSNNIYIFLTFFSYIFFIRDFGIVLPNKGTAFLFIAIASKTPSHNTIGSSQLINKSNPITSLDTGGFLYFIPPLYMSLPTK